MRFFTTRPAIASLVFIAAILFFSNAATAQKHKKKKDKEAQELTIYDIDTLARPIPRQRMLFHDRIDHEQHKADFKDGVGDNTIFYSEENPEYTAILTKAILGDVDHIQRMIENMPQSPGADAVADNQSKIRYLQALNEMLKKYNADVKVDPYYYRKLTNNLHDMIIADNEGKLMDFAHAHANIYTLENGKWIFSTAPEVRAYVYTEMGRQDPVMMIKKLKDFYKDDFADQIISDAARIDPSEVFNYASSTDPHYRDAVRRSKDPLVQTIVNIADKSKSPLKAMPFLMDIHTGQLTISQVDVITDNPDLYFQNLVRIKLQNNNVGGDTYSEELAYRSLYYVRKMDDLHESPDPVRFKCIDGMDPTTLYFIMVYGQDEIYTSSFLGTFKRMMERMKGMKGDSLFTAVHYDHFRTFIRMCAGYNTLSSFLSTMDADAKAHVMSDFIAGLQKGKEDDLEDAVDVADAYGSIRDSSLAEFLQKRVKENYELSYKERSKKGLVIYSLLSRLFEGAKTSNDTDAAHQSEVLGLPPIYMVPFKSLQNDSGIIYEQAFFYGDEDGKVSYDNFMGMFRDGKWKINNQKSWSQITSISGKPIVIYANLPIPEPGDEEAQNELCKYLEDANIHPTVIIHRGHSYHLPTTMDHLSKNTKIVMLGSCGGYHNLAVVLDHSPDAHIISSKQTGMERINEPIIKSLNTEMLAGDDIDWIKIWTNLGDYFNKKPDIKEKFEDYVPPYKNLGAIFIKAYRKMLNAES